MKFEVHVDKKHFFILLGAILILAGAIYGHAQSGGIVSHTWEEIENSPEQATRWATADEIDWSVPISSVIKQDISSTSYDIYFQGGTGSGTSRNLALLGVLNTDKLYVNYASEYTGGTQIGGPVKIIGDLDVSGEIGVTTKTYGPYSTQTNINLGVWQYCSFGGMTTSRENHGAKVWKSGSNWYAGSTGFSDASVQQFWVNCWKFS